MSQPRGCICHQVPASSNSALRISDNARWIWSMYRLQYATMRWLAATSQKSRHPFTQPVWAPALGYGTAAENCCLNPKVRTIELASSVKQYKEDRAVLSSMRTSPPITVRTAYMLCTVLFRADLFMIVPECSMVLGRHLEVRMTISSRKLESEGYWVLNQDRRIIMPDDQNFRLFRQESLSQSRSKWGCLGIYFRFLHYTYNVMNIN
jgi:hypothetical protein